MNRFARAPMFLFSIVAALLAAGPARGQAAKAGSFADKQGGDITIDAIRNTPGQNKMVWVSAPKAGRLPVVDGTLNLEQGEWADAPAVSGMLMPNGGRLLPLKALTFITWDADHFYLGMRTEVKPGYTLRRRGRDMDGDVSRDDVIELMFNPLGRDQPETALFQLMYNALGYRWDAMVTVGVTAKYWDAEGWEFKSDYKPGMDHWDLEIKIPVKSMRMKSPNASGQCWLMLATRDWKNLVDEQGKPLWNVYSSLTGNGGFISQENQFPFILDDSAPVVQLLDLGDLCNGQFGFRARFANTTGKPQTFTALASVYDNTAYQGRDQDWSLREKPLATQSRTFTLKPGEAADWVLPATALPALTGNEAKRIVPLYGFVFNVSREGSATPLFVRQCDFNKKAYTGKATAGGYPMDIAYNPVRGTLMPSCDILDYPDKTKIKGLQVEVFPAGEKADGPPLLAALVTRVSKDILSDRLPLADLKPGSYPARMALLDADGKPVATNAFTILKLDEAATFPWWNSTAGLSDTPAPPHQPMRVEGNAVITTTGSATFDGSAMPAQMMLAGKDLLAAPVRLTASAGGKPLAFAAGAAPVFGRKTAVATDLTGALHAGEIRVTVSNHMEYDGAQWITLDLAPAAPAVRFDYLRLEIPFKPERGQLLFTMAMSGRESWVAEPLTAGEGKVWDSSKCRGLGMTVGTFVPQYLISDSIRGLCWFANNDQGWVPTDEVPAAEVVRQGGETILRFNLIGQPFTVKGPRRIAFGLLGMPARPFPAGARIVERKTSQFGTYVGDPVVGYSYPMPRDFAKARDFMEKGTLYDKKTLEPLPAARAKEWLQEFAPWHDSHTPWKTPDLDPRTYDYMAREFEGLGFLPKLINLRSWQWERYVKAAPISGLYYDTPEGMGFSRSIQNEVAYLIPVDQPHGGEVQGGYNITGFREQIKRIYTICHQNSIDNPWIEMHSTHGCAVPASAFLSVRIDGEDFRRPSYRNFMAAWPVNHLRAIDVPALYGNTTRWLGGYPWDNQARDVDPLRCQMAALFVHDVWSTGFGNWSSPTISGKGVLIQACDREPPYGFKSLDVPAKLIGLGMNLADTQFLPYWDNAGALTLTGADGKDAKEVRASGWRVPSQNRLIVVAANWNGATIPCRLKIDPVALGAAGEADSEILITDLESDAVLARGKAAETIDFTVRPLDFRMFMATRVAPGLPPALGTLTNASLAAKLQGLGINRADARLVPPADKTLELTGGVAVCEPVAWLIPLQKRLIVALGNPGDKPLAGKLKVNLSRLGLMPANNGECIVITDLASDKVLLKTTGVNRGQLLGLWKGLKDAEGRKISSPADEVNVTVPAGGGAFLMVATQ